jgi:hypothetical protein
MATTLNASTSNGLIQTADTSGVLALQAADTTIASVSSTGVSVTGAITATGQIAAIKSATSQASTSGTSIDFTSIPAGVKRITVMFAGVSTNGTSNIIIQLGTGATPTYTITGYLGGIIGYSGAGFSNFTTGFIVANALTAAYNQSGQIIINNVTSNTWTESSALMVSNNNAGNWGAGHIPLGAALTAVRVTTVAGTDTFDAGSINILYE